MPSATQPIQPNGAVVSLMLQLSDADAQAVEAKGERLPTPSQPFAFLDIGASHSSIEHGYLRTLGAAQLSEAAAYRAMGSADPVSAGRYRIKLTVLFTNGQQFGPLELEVFEAHMRHSNCYVCLGRDFLAKTVLLYDGPNNEFTLSW